MDGYQRNRYGNRTPTWNTINEYAASDYKGLVHIRNRVAGGPTWYDVPADKVARVYCDVTNQGLLRPADAYFSGMAPTKQTTFQGEVRRSERGLDLTYSRVPKPMRQSLLEGLRTAEGIVAVELIRYYMDATSYDWLGELLDGYANAVVEFSCYSVPCGTLNLNTLFWEVRVDY